MHVTDTNLNNDIDVNKGYECTYCTVVNKNFYTQGEGLNSHGEKQQEGFNVQVKFKAKGSIRKAKN